MLSVSAEAQPENVGAIRNAVVAVAREAGVPQALLYDVKLCVSEAAANAVRHAYRDRERGVVRVDVRVVGRELEIEVADDGRGIDSSRPIDNGLGHELIYRLTRRSSMQTAPGVGTTVQLVFPLVDAEERIDLPWKSKTPVGKLFAL